MAKQLRIRRVAKNDLEAIIALDERITSVSKPHYWSGVFKLFENSHDNEQVFLVAEKPQENSDVRLLGYVAGEIRAWEFGSEPCGWVFAISVEPDAREQGIGEKLFEAIAERFRQKNIMTMRTMVARENQLHMAFFRSAGMTAGPYLQLEMDLEEQATIK